MFPTQFLTTLSTLFASSYLFSMFFPTLTPSRTVTLPAPPPVPVAAPLPLPEPLCNFKYITRKGNKRGETAMCERIASECNYHRKLPESQPPNAELPEPQPPNAALCNFYIRTKGNSDASGAFVICGRIASECRYHGAVSGTPLLSRTVPVPQSLHRRWSYLFPTIPNALSKHFASSC